MYKVDSWKDKLPDFFRHEILVELGESSSTPSTQTEKKKHQCVSFIWRHKAGHQISLERCYIEIQLTERINYQIVIEDQPLESHKPGSASLVHTHVNREPGEKIHENRRAREVALDYVAVFLEAFKYITVDIAPQCLLPIQDHMKYPTNFVSMCEKLTIRGTWDYRNENLVGQWLAKFETKNITIISGSTCARINNSPTLAKAATVSITGFTDIDEDFLHRFKGQHLKIEGGVIQLISGAGVVNMLSTWIRDAGVHLRDVLLEGVMLPNFAEKILDYLRLHKLLGNCIVDVETNNFSFNHNFPSFHLKIDTKSNYIHARIPEVKTASPEKSPVAKGSSAKKSGSKKK